MSERPPFEAIESLVFFGTPAFAVPSLQALCDVGRRPRLVVSQPARPVGRRQEVVDPPVAAWARRAGLDVVQPEKTRTPSFRKAIEELEPDLCVVVAYGELLTRRMLEVPRLGFVNVHASLLPRYRGAAPIQAAIANGDRVTGVTTMQLEPGLDTGPMLLRKETRIGRRETAEELSFRLAELGADLLVETVDRLEFDLITPEPQDHEAASYAPRLSREDGVVAWSLTADELYDRWRAYTPWPGVTVEWEGERLKLIEVVPAPAGSGGRSSEAGSVLGIEGKSLLMACGGGTVLAVRTVQRPGRRPVSGAEFARSVEAARPSESTDDSEE